MDTAETCTEETAAALCNDYFYGNDAVDIGVESDPCIEQPWLLPNSSRLELDHCCDDPISKACLDQVTEQVSLASNGTLQWSNPAYNFDSIQAATKTMFFMATTEGWVEIMNCGMDVPHRAGLPPIQNAAWALSIYFVVFQVVGASFCMALFTGVLVSYFSSCSGPGTLTTKQKEWVHVKLLVLRVHDITIEAPRDTIRAAAYSLYTWPWWEVVVSGVILLQVGFIAHVRVTANSINEARYYYMACSSAHTVC